MIPPWKCTRRRMSSSLWILILLILLILTACGGSSSSTTSGAIQTYTGSGFTIQYPASWHVFSSQSHGISSTVIRDTISNNAFTIEKVPDPQGLESAATIADSSVQAVLTAPNLEKSQRVSIPATVALNGIIWVQRKITYITCVHGQGVPTTILLLVTIHPAHSVNTQAYRLVYGGPTVLFNQNNAQIFQPILYSFHFT